MIFVFCKLSFTPTFSLSSFTFIKRPFSFSLISAIRVVSSAYLRLLIFLPAILIPAYASSSLAFLMMYSAYKLNKQGDNKQPWRTPFPLRNQSVVPCPVLTVASWPAYRFLKRQVRWPGIPISSRILHSLLRSEEHTSELQSPDLRGGLGDSPNLLAVLSAGGMRSTRLLLLLFRSVSWVLVFLYLLVHHLPQLCSICTAIFSPL